MCHLDTAGKLHIWTQGTCDTMFKIYANLNRTKSQHGEASWSHNATPSWRNSESSFLLGEEISVFSKSIATISWSHSNKRPHILEYWDSTNRLWWGKKLGGKERGYRSGKSLDERKWVWSKLLYKILEALITRHLTTEFTLACSFFFSFKNLFLLPTMRSCTENSEVISSGPTKLYHTIFLWNSFYHLINPNLLTIPTLSCEFC